MPALALPIARPDPAVVLGEALLNVGKALDLNQSDLAHIIGKDRSNVSRGAIAPDSKAGELALMLIRAYRALYVLVGGDPEQMRHWMHTRNLHTGGVPAEQVRQVQGLVQVVEYLDAMRGRS
jgi:hypothetical protein